MRGTKPAMATALLLVSANAWGAGPDESWDGLLTQAAVVPEARTVRVSVGGGGFADRGVDSGTIGSSVLWSPIARLAANMSTTWEEGTMSPAVAVRYQLLSQQTMGIDGTVSVGYQAVGFEATGSEGLARLALGRSFGPVALNSSAMVGKGFAGRDDVDFEAGGSVLVRVVSFLRVGVEGRLRTELVDELHTDEDVGRPNELTLGGTAAVRLDWFRIQGLGGWRAPRGSADPGPIALASVAFDF